MLPGRAGSLSEGLWKLSRTSDESAFLRTDVAKPTQIAFRECIGLFSAVQNLLERIASDKPLALPFLRDGFDGPGAVRHFERCLARN